MGMQELKGLQFMNVTNLVLQLESAFRVLLILLLESSILA